MSFAGIAAAIGTGVAAAGTAAAGAAGSLVGGLGAGVGGAIGGLGGAATSLGATGLGSALSGAGAGLTGASGSLAAGLGGSTGGLIGSGASAVGGALPGTVASQGLSAALKGGGQAGAQAAAQAPQIGLRGSMGADMASAATKMGAPESMATAVGDKAGANWGQEMFKQDSSTLAQDTMSKTQEMSGMPDPGDQEGVMASLEANKIRNEGTQAANQMRSARVQQANAITPNFQNATPTPQGGMPNQMATMRAAQSNALTPNFQNSQMAPNGGPGTTADPTSLSSGPADGQQMGAIPKETWQDKLEDAASGAGTAVGKWGANQAGGLASQYLSQLIGPKKSGKSRTTSAGRDSISSIRDLNAAMGPSRRFSGGKPGQGQSQQAMLQMLQQMGGRR